MTLSDCKKATLNLTTRIVRLDGGYTCMLGLLLDTFRSEYGAPEIDLRCVCNFIVRSPEASEAAAYECIAPLGHRGGYQSLLHVRSHG